MELDLTATGTTHGREQGCILRLFDSDERHYDRRWCTVPNHEWKADQGAAFVFSQ